MSGTQPNRELLTKAYQKAYDSMLQCMNSRRDSAKVLERDFGILGEVFEFIKLDNPLLYYVENIQMQVSSAGLFATINPVYNAYKDDAFLRQQIEDIGQRVTARATSLDPWNVLLYLHDTICKTVIYDDIGKDAHTVVGALIHKHAVCDGISKSFKYFCDLLGIPCCVVTGRAKRSYDSFAFENHAWNKVMINGLWFNIDVTYDLTIGNNNNIRHDYFLVTDQCISSSHVEDNRRFPATTVGRDFYTVNNLLMNTQSDLVNHIKSNYKKGVRFFEVKLPSTKDIDTVEGKIFDVVSNALRFQKIMFKAEIYSNKDMLVFGIIIS